MNILLTNSDFIKSITNLSDNTSDKYLHPAIKEAQDIELCEILGEVLLNKLKMLIHTREINNPMNGLYKELLNTCQYFLAYTVLSKLCVTLSFKLDNVGLSRTSDENITYATESEMNGQVDYYRNKADFFTLKIQNFILRHRNDIPEITPCLCNTIQANMFSAESCGIVLGGARGKARYNNPLDYIGK